MATYKTIYTVYIGNEDTGKGVSFSTSNKVTLSKNADVPYNDLIREFNRKKRVVARIGNVLIIKSTIFLPGMPRNNIGGFKRSK